MDAQMNKNSPYQTYRQTLVQTADRGQLLLIVYNAAIRFTREAQEKIRQQDIAGKGQKIDKAYAAVAELRKTLDMEQGKEIARSLDRLYGFLLRQITLANIRNDAQALDIVVQILEDLRSAWEEVVKKHRAEKPAGDQKRILA
jgi:flagellar protein FliS